MRSPALEVIFQAARDEWSEPRATAIETCHALLALTRTDWALEGSEAVKLLRQKRRDSALLLAVSEAAMWEDPVRAASSLHAVLADLEDIGWATTIAAALLNAGGTVHVLSMGESTTLVLDELSRLSDSLPLVHAHQAAVARGLGNLDVAVAVAEPGRAESLLLPVAAVHNDRIWTTPHFIEVAARFPRSAIPVHHPLAAMSPLSREQFRPPSTIVSTRISRDSSGPPSGH